MPFPGMLMRRPIPGALMPKAQQPMGALGMPVAVQDPSIDPSYYRRDGSMKGQGFLGPLKTPDGRHTMTEYSIGVRIGDKEMDIPSLVPTLTPEEIKHIVNGGDITEAIQQKAVDHAIMRMKQNLPVFSE